MPRDDSVVFEQWQRLLDIPKSTFDYPTWEFLQLVYDNRDAAKPSLKSRSAQRMQLLVQLADNYDIALEGVRVRFYVWADRPMEDITVIFEVLHLERWTVITRIDFLPYGPHINKHWRKFGLPPDVNGSHIHSYKDNVKLGSEAFTAAGNLPNGVPLDDEPKSFREICRLVGQKLRIEGCENLPMPEWNGSLL
ncbi:hypothetical protein [Neorhizobium petrolearium]|uniref:Uncharacterized protein n=1 Tax=Neorhizobium petrolearium TaxID=515361 RepID=A0ABY8M7M4_9HYPH|nr:hypothetical protein [Neorhizobium petrolearium]MCC2610384.1 hypothetical protein [Neorhizobium petrolearium]WGI70530.1 hypothetical protein QEO92_11065 [Neorhizobium petrolearium]